MFEQGRQRVDGADADAGIALRQARDLEHEHQPDHFIGQWCAGSRAVRQQQIALQLRQAIVRYSRLRQKSEAGVDAVDRFAVGEDAAHRGVALLDAHACIGGNAEPNGALQRGAQVRQRQLAGVDAAHNRVCGAVHRSAPDEFCMLSIGRFNPCSRAQASASG